MTGKLSTRIISLGAALAGLAAMTALTAPTSTAADTEVKRVGATIIYKNVAHPARPGNCGVLVILEWKDPQVKGFEPTGWTGHYFFGPPEARVEKTITGTPPFHNTQDIMTVNFYATGGANWFQVGWKSRAASPAAGYPLDCSDQVAKLQGLYGTQAWVDVTGTVSDSTTAKCLKAREKFTSARKKVTQLRRDLRKAKSEAGKAKIRNRLDAAVKKRAQSAAGLGKACNG
jgi:hypothetical protein